MSIVTPAATQATGTDNLPAAWDGFTTGPWQDAIDVRDFIQRNYTPYAGDASFLVGPTERTTRVWDTIAAMFPEEREKGIYDVDPHTPAGITAHAPGYISEDDSLVVGLQTDAPLKRAIMPNGGWRMVEGALETYGYEVDQTLKAVFTFQRKTHNQGVFDVYPPAVRAARSSHIITGLPDAYGRGRIIGDYRRVALYGVDALIQAKKLDKLQLDTAPFGEEVVRMREEHAEQIRALAELKEMAASYGVDISGPATTAREAVQWLYFAYLGAVKEQNGAAMSLGRTSTFLDVYIDRDLEAGAITEQQAQELIDDFVIKLRIVRFLRTPEYDELFSGDPTWVTETIGGVGEDGRALVTKNSFRYLQTLYNLGPAPEPNMTVFWSAALPKGFKDFCARVTIDTSAVQYESDDLIRAAWGDDAAIACCVSPMQVGKQMQFFGARVNLAKTMLYAINGGRDEVSGKQVGPGIRSRRRRRSRLRRRHGPLRWADGLAGRRPTSRPSTASTGRTTSTRTSASRWRCTTRTCCARWPAASQGSRSPPTRCRPSSTRRSPRCATSAASSSTTSSTESSRPSATTTTASTPSPSTSSSAS